ncbi:hypothetical protein L218DRAFT_725083 [Marasmius fiardii PR-910]|nr:hypothetical protein L218DRAFT_725083 [Marasmius fiardii PR-910]
MPRSSTTPSSNPAGSQCPDCGFIPVRRSDMARHKKIHSENKEELLHRCPWPGCTVASLQKSNINTHYNTHTRKKTKCCPDCTFRTVDPGSLTRHRKSLHDYVPKPRNRVNVVALPRNDPDCSTATTRRARRRAPYPSSRRTRLSRAPVSSESASSSPLSIPDEPVFIESKYTAMSLAHGFDTQYFWRPRDGGRIGRTPSPRIVLPAVDTGRHLEGEPRSEETHTQVPAVIDQARPESSATTCHWDTIGLHFDPVANDCSVNFGQQTIPQYLLGEADASWRN